MAPDDHTVPSEVARLSVDSGMPIRVVNFGFPSSSSRQEVGLMATVRGHAVEHLQRRATTGAPGDRAHTDERGAPVAGAVLGCDPNRRHAPVQRPRPQQRRHRDVLGAWRARHRTNTDALAIRRGATPRPSNAAALSAPVRLEDRPDSTQPQAAIDLIGNRSPSDLPPSLEQPDHSETAAHQAVLADLPRNEVQRRSAYHRVALPVD